jgi:iron(III) transport system permease protein
MSIVSECFGKLKQASAGLPPFYIWLSSMAVAGAMLLPLVYLILRAMGASSEVWDLLLRFHTLEILLRSVSLVVAVTAGCIAIALPLAWLTVCTDLPCRRLWVALTSLPLVIPSFVGGYLMVVALGPKGMLQDLLETLFDVERIPEIYGFPGAFLALTLLSFPYVLLPVRAALRRLDPGLEEISNGLGNGAWVTLRLVVLPQLRPSIVAGALLVALYTLSDFGAVSLLRYETFTWAIYLQFEGVADRGLAAALSLVLMGLAFGILFLEHLSRGGSQYYRSGAGQQKSRKPMALGRWRWVALAYCAAIVLFALALPLGILLYWVIRGLGAGEQVPSLWHAAWNSILVSGLTGVVAVIAALPVALCVVRYPGWISGLLERISYVGFALPGIVVALALVFFGANYVWPVYQTIVLLIFAYVVLFLPTALGSIRSSLLQVNPRLEEAASGLGHSQLKVLLKVTVPLVKSGLLVGGALVFLVTMKELPATLILGPIGFATLATATWSAASEAFFAQAAAPALLLVIFAFIPMLVLIINEDRAH